MKRRTFLAGAAALGAAPALAQTTAPAPAPVSPAQTAPASAPPPATATAPAPGPVPPTPNPMGKIIKVKLATGQGDIVIELYPDKAPITVANWLRYVDQKRYDGAHFYRASHPPGVFDYGVIQGGLDPAAPRLAPIAHEPTTKTGLKHLDGAISMGRTAPGTATSDFFICLGDSPYLDADPAKPGDNRGFATFGRVVEGMEVVRKIITLPTSPTKGVGVMKGEMLEPRVPIKTARRVA